MPNSADTTYIQCTLRRREGASEVETVRYLPAKYAVAGRTVMLKPPNEDPLQLGLDWVAWTVAATDTANPVFERPNPVAAIKDHRRRTGDSLPKSGS